MKRRLYPKPLLIGGRQVPPFTEGATRTDDGRWLILYPHPIRDAEMFCCLPESLVLTPEGEVSIKDIRVNDVVRGRSGWTRVLHTLGREFSGGVVYLETPHGITKVTGNHPIATPLGWLDADKFRKSSVLVGVSPRVDPSEFVDVSDVSLVVASLPASESGHPVLVVMGDGSVAEINQNLGVPLLPSKVGKNVSQEASLGLRSANGSNDPSGSLLGVFGVGEHGNRVDFSGFGQEFGTPVNDGLVRVGDGYSCLELIPSGDGKATLAVDDASEVAPFGFSHVQMVARQHYCGRVHNLATADGTFVVDGVLTHNCSFHLDKAFEKWGMYLPEDAYTDTLNELIHHLWRMEEKFDPERNDSFENYARTYLPKRAADVGPRRILGRSGNRVNDYLHEELDADLQGPGLGQPFSGERGDSGFDWEAVERQLPSERDRINARYLDIIRLRDGGGTKG